MMSTAGLFFINDLVCGLRVAGRSSRGNSLLFVNEDWTESSSGFPVSTHPHDGDDFDFDYDDDDFDYDDYEFRSIVPVLEVLGDRVFEKVASD
ncbi:GL11488 [Drosophila persimilis]|uniref:GL11488 n=1 Tax=Drosophila persimilis TaxID=7234 RepID=B4GB48_DROPE|nr:GL11488 [Drosophila persimilis]